ncbi:MAG: translesion error-prone DNA polymerase V autoproteolytic subunit [Candidatus Competibacteraceae bacterium]
MLAVVAERSTARGWSPAFELEPAPERGWPLLAAPVPAGFPSPADDQVERRLSLDEHLIRQPESTFLVRASGDSLAGAGIHDGDLLVVDRAVPPTAGSIVVAVVDGAFALVRLGRDAGGRRVLQSAHPEYPDRALGDGQELAIWGVARWAIHRLWPGRDRSP